MKPRRSMREVQLCFILGGLALLAILSLVYVGGRWLESRYEQPETRGVFEQPYGSKLTIEVDGTSYRVRSRLTSLLLIGVDQDSDVSPTGFRNGGQADFLRLIVLDAERQTIAQLEIDRDTMTPITVLGVLGNRSGMRIAQISLSHGFGDGAEMSCQLTVEAVSDLLLGTQIDFYLALNMDGIAALNDWAGGVTVTLKDDLTALDPSMLPGVTLTLTGEQAEAYVRARHNVGVGTNEERMERQRQYIDALIDKLVLRLSENQEAIGSLYDALELYLTTDLSRGRLINELWAAHDYQRTAPIALEGTHQVGEDGFMEFYVQEDSLKEQVLNLFYEQVE